MQIGRGSLFSNNQNANFYTYGIENPMAAIENLTARPALRNIIGDLEADQTLTTDDIHGFQDACHFGRSD